MGQWTLCTASLFFFSVPIYHKGTLSFRHILKLGVVIYPQHYKTRIQDYHPPFLHFGLEDYFTMSLALPH